MGSIATSFGKEMLRILRRTAFWTDPVERVTVPVPIVPITLYSAQFTYVF
jgi:hypothetical protein